MIVTAYGRHNGRDVQRVALDVSEQDQDTLNEIALAVSAASSEPIDKVILVWEVQHERIVHLPVSEHLPLMEETHADHNG